MQVNEVFHHSCFTQPSSVIPVSINHNNSIHTSVKHSPVEEALLQCFVLGKHPAIRLFQMVLGATS